MHRKALLLMAVSGILLACAAPAFAVLSVPFGWYVEANAGSTRVTNASYPGSSSSSSSGIGGNANIGYKFMPYLGAEIGYSLYANTSIKDSFGNKAGSDRRYNYNASLRGIFPIIDSGAELFAKVGVGRLVSSISINNSAAANAIGLGSSTHSATNLYLAAGAQYYFMPELAVVAQWARAQGNSSTGNVDLISGGLSFIFD